MHDDIDIQRQVLQELMDMLDQKDRGDMAGSLMGDKSSEPTDPMAADKPADDSSIDGQPEPDEDDVKSVDPVVMLAKRLGKK
jgi:hypothetical protein